jgi:hypothetical protein
MALDRAIAIAPDLFDMYVACSRGVVAIGRPLHMVDALCKVGWRKA